MATAFAYTELQKHHTWLDLMVLCINGLAFGPAPKHAAHVVY